MDFVHFVDFVHAGSCYVPASVDFVPGATIRARYRLKQLVGAGGMGEVWSAEDTQTRVTVALKHLLPAAAKHHEVVIRFKREAYLLGKLESQYVARVKDFFDDEVYGLVLVMDFIEGPSLANMLEDQTLSVEDAIDLAVDLLRALTDLHQTNIVHRDLKPGNIIMRPLKDGTTRAMIVDFGISRLIPSHGEEVTGITRANIALGTVEYMAPEQILNSRDVTAVTDLYAVGIILFRAVKGHHAFGDRRGEDLARAKLIEEAPALTMTRKDDLALGLAALVGRALKKKPANRYASAKDMLEVALALQEKAKDLAEMEETTTDGGRTAVKVSPVAAALTKPRPPTPRPAAGRPAEPPRTANEASRPPTRAKSPSPGAPAPAEQSVATALVKPSQSGALRGTPTSQSASNSSAAPPSKPSIRGPLPSVPEVEPIGRAPLDSRPITRASMPSISSISAVSERSLDFDTRRSLPDVGGAPVVMSAAPSAPISEKRKGIVVPWGMLLLGFITTLAVGAAVGMVIAPSPHPECPQCADEACAETAQAKPTDAPTPVESASPPLTVVDFDDDEDVVPSASVSAKPASSGTAKAVATSSVKPVFTGKLPTATATSTGAPPTTATSTATSPPTTPTEKPPVPTATSTPPNIPDGL